MISAKKVAHKRYIFTHLPFMGPKLFVLHARFWVGWLVGWLVWCNKKGAKMEKNEMNTMIRTFCNMIATINGIGQRKNKSCNGTERSVAAPSHYGAGVGF
jgi:hypothetical protein